MASPPCMTLYLLQLRYFPCQQKRSPWINPWPFVICFKVIIQPTQLLHSFETKVEKGSKVLLIEFPKSFQRQLDKFWKAFSPQRGKKLAKGGKVWKYNLHSQPLTSFKSCSYLFKKLLKKKHHIVNFSASESWWKRFILPTGRRERQRAKKREKGNEREE